MTLRRRCSRVRTSRRSAKVRSARLRRTCPGVESPACVYSPTVVSKSTWSWPGGRRSTMSRRASCGRSTIPPRSRISSSKTSHRRRANAPHSRPDLAEGEVRPMTRSRAAAVFGRRAQCGCRRTCRRPFGDTPERTTPTMVVTPNSSRLPLRLGGPAASHGLTGRQRSFHKQQPWWRRLESEELAMNGAQTGLILGALLGLALILEGFGEMLIVALASLIGWVIARVAHRRPRRRRSHRPHLAESAGSQPMSVVAASAEDAPPAPCAAERGTLTIKRGWSSERPCTRCGPRRRPNAIRKWTSSTSPKITWSWRRVSPWRIPTSRSARCSTVSATKSRKKSESWSVAPSAASTSPWTNFRTAPPARRRVV